MKRHVLITAGSLVVYTTFAVAIVMGCAYVAEPPHQTPPPVEAVPPPGGAWVSEPIRCDPADITARLAALPKEMAESAKVFTHMQWSYFQSEWKMSCHLLRRP